MKNKIIAITQRVEVDVKSGERRDMLDQNWAKFLSALDFAALPLPNHLPTVQKILAEMDFAGIILSGGNDLSRYGGLSPERDEVERFLLEHGLLSSCPLLGVCRGMQLIQDYFGVRLEKIPGHVRVRIPLIFSAQPQQKWEVNSFHDWGSRTSVKELEVVAKAPDGVIKFIQHQDKNIRGIMWHPERETSWQEKDLELFAQTFSEAQ